jgi:hypothetical protein
MYAAGIEPVTSRWKTSIKATKLRALFYFLKASFFHLDELVTSEFWLNLYDSRRPKQMFVKYASLVYEPGATKLSFFLQQWPQKGAVSVTECKLWSAIMASISRKSSNKVPIILFRMLLAGRQTHNNIDHFFMGLRRFLWVRLWDVKILSIWIMGVTLVLLSAHDCQVPTPSSQNLEVEQKIRI